MHVRMLVFLKLTALTDKVKFSLLTYLATGNSTLAH